MSQTEVQLIKDSAVVTADIADQAVTLDKLPHGTSSNNGKFLRANNGADPTFETVTSTTINSNADNRVITGSGTADTLNGESALTFDGQTLTISASTNDTPLLIDTGSSNGAHLRFQKDGSNKHFFGSGGGFGLGDVDDLSLRTVDNIIFGVGTSEKMRMDSSGNLGIGTTPNEKLVVNGNSSVTGALFITSNTSTPSAGAFLYRPASNTLAFGSNSAERMRMDSVGAVLVGHSTSRNNFNSAASSEHAPVIQLEGANQKRTLSLTAVSNSDGGFLILARQNGSVGQNTAVSSGQQVGKIDFQGSGGTNMEVAARISADVDGTPGDNDMPGRLCFKTTADGSNSPSEHMRIHSTGQVSISHPNNIADSHDYKLVVKPNIQDSSKGALGIYVDGDTGTSGGAAVDSISLKVLNTGTFNNATHQYGGFFEVNQQLLQPQTGVYSQATGLYSTQKCFAAKLNKNIAAVTTGVSYESVIVTTNSGGDAFHFRGYDDSTEKIRINKNGDIDNSNNSYGSLSDIKLKENIVDANSQWDDIKALKVRNFNFKDDPDKVKMLGLVAQEAEAVSAGLVKINNDIEIDESTGEGTITGTTKYVKYSILYMKSVKALQEAMSRIETLETEVATLKSA